MTNDDKMPALPFSPLLICDWATEHEKKTRTVYEADQMLAYARQYAAEQTASLRARVEELGRGCRQANDMLEYLNTQVIPQLRALLTASDAALRESRANDMESMRQLTATRDKLAAAEKDADWQHMETAPRDGGEVLIRVQRAGTVGALIAHYMEGGHCIEDHPPIARGWYFWTGYDFRPTESAPTGWLPIPPTSAYQAEIAARRAAIASSKEQRP